MSSQRLSVVVSTHSQGRRINQVLEYLLRSREGVPNLQIIVAVNDDYDGSTARRLQEEAAPFSRGFENLRFVSTSCRGLLASRMLGFFAAESDVVAFIDDDFLVNEHWVKTAIELFADKKVEIATGPSIPRYEGQPSQWVREFEVHTASGLNANYLLSLVTSVQRDKKWVDPTFVFGQNLLIRRKTLLRHGGFGPDLMPRNLRIFAGDGEFALTHSLLEAGIRARWDIGLGGTHLIPQSRLSTKTIFWRGYYDGVVNLFHKSRRRGFASLDDLIHDLRAMLRSNLRSVRVATYWAGRISGEVLWLSRFRVSPFFRAWVLSTNFFSTWDPKQLKG